MTTFKHFFINEDGSDEGNDDEVDHGNDCQVHHLVAEIPPQDDEGEEKDIWSVKTSQELRMLSSLTINCQITKIVMNSGSQLSEL